MISKDIVSANENYCNNNEIQCFFDDSAPLRCTPKSKVCDGKQDCPYGDDELNCDNVVQVQESQAIKLECLKDDIACLNGETNITECLNIMYFCDAYQKEVFCDNHKDIDDEILKDLCSYYKLSKKSSPFDCGQSVFISRDMVGFELNF